MNGFDANVKRCGYLQRLLGGINVDKHANLPRGTYVAHVMTRHGAGATWWDPGSVPRLRQESGCTLPRLLVVDDEASHARVMAIGLRIEGFEVEIVPNAEGALRLLADQDFDAAVVDLMLPGTNGIQLARMVRDRHPHTRIVLTSAYHLSERQLLRVDCGAVGFVPKPFDLSELARFLRSKLPDGEPERPFATPGAAA